MDYRKQVKEFKCSVPVDYFDGIKSHHMCYLDNVLVFRRENWSILSRRNFESRPHYRYVLAINLETEGNISVDGSMFPFHPGDAFLIGPHQFHYYADIESEELNWVYITFESDEQEAFANIVNHPIRLDEDAFRLLSIVLEDSQAEDLETNSLLKNRLLLKTQLLMTHLQTLVESQKQRYFTDVAVLDEKHQLLNKIQEVLEKELGNGIDIPLLAEQVHLSPSHLRSKFKKITGVSLGKYLVHYKMNQAIRWILDSQQSLSTISEWVGYESQAAFCRSFKSVFGMSPAQYRKKNAR